MTRKTRRFVVMSTLLLGALSAKSQDTVATWVDALMYRVQHAPNDSVQHRLRMELLERAGHAERAEALREAERGLLLARRNGDTAREAYLLHAMGLLHWRCGEFDQALALHQGAYHLYEQLRDENRRVSVLRAIAQDHIDAGAYALALPVLKDIQTHYQRTGDRKALAESWSLLAYVLYAQGDPTGAMDAMHQQLSMSEESGDTLNMALTEANIGELELELGHAAEALRMLNEALRLRDRAAVKEDMNLALTHVSIGDAHLKLHQYNDAASAYRSTLAIARRLNEPTAAGLAYRGMAMISDEQGDPSNALVDYELAAQELEAGGFGKVDLAHIYARIGILHARLGHLARSRSYLQRIDSLARDIHSRNILSDLNRAAEYLDSTRRDWHGAYLHQKLHILYRDSIFGEENRENIAKAQVRYESEKKMLADSLSFAADKAVQVQEIKKQKVIRNSFMLGFALVVAFAGVFFFQRNRIAREKARSEELLLNILPEEVAEELKAKGEAEARQIDHVTVLFTDFKGFTAMSERVTAKELVRDLNECFSAFDRIMEKHGIEKIKTIGDAYMAAGGLPTPNTTHALDAVKAALEVRDFIDQGKARKVAAGLPFFEIRIGIHTGPVVAGIVGVKKFAYDIWGDTVNTASRMESSGAVGQVNISESTYVLVKNEAGLTFTPRGKVQAKGKGEMEMYFVEQAGLGA